MVEIDKDLLLYLLEYLDGFHNDKEGAQNWMDAFCRGYPAKADVASADVATEGSTKELRLCEGGKPRYPRG